MHAYLSPNDSEDDIVYAPLHLEARGRQSLLRWLKIHSQRCGLEQGHASLGGNLSATRKFI